MPSGSSFVPFCSERDTYTLSLLRLFVCCVGCGDRGHILDEDWQHGDKIVLSFGFFPCRIASVKNFSSPITWILCGKDDAEKASWILVWPLASVCRAECIGLDTDGVFLFIRCYPNQVLLQCPTWGKCFCSLQSVGLMVALLVSSGNNLDCQGTVLFLDPLEETN